MIKGQFCSSAEVCASFTTYICVDGENRHGQIMSDKTPNVHDQIAFRAFHSFFTEVQMKLATYSYFTKGCPQKCARNNSKK